MAGELTWKLRCRRHGKVIFASEDDAEREIERIMRAKNRRGSYRPVRSYEEPLCKGWHVTSQLLVTDPADDRRQ